MNTFTELYNECSSVISTLLLIISLFASILAFYNKIKSKISESISKFINQAEEEVDLTGPEKMDLVVSWVQDIIPRLFKVVFTADILEKIAQNIYKDMAKYRDNYVKNKTGLSTNKVIDIVKNVVDDPDASINKPEG